MASGDRIVDELAVANAHPAGAKPFGREDYIRKFRTLTEDIVTDGESTRFLELVQDLPALSADGVRGLNVQLAPDRLEAGTRNDQGIF